MQDELAEKGKKMLKFQKQIIQLRKVLKVLVCCSFVIFQIVFICDCSKLALAFFSAFMSGQSKERKKLKKYSLKEDWLFAATTQTGQQLKFVSFLNLSKYIFFFKSQIHFRFESLKYSFLLSLSNTFSFFSLSKYILNLSLSNNFLLAWNHPSNI